MWLTARINTNFISSMFAKPHMNNTHFRLGKKGPPVKDLELSCHLQLDTFMFSNHIWQVMLVLSQYRWKKQEKYPPASVVLTYIQMQNKSSY